jgi:hypothetical protein
MTAKSFKKDSFFIIETDANNAGQILGQCFVDPHSMFYFAEWLRGGEVSKYSLLVSLDGKYAMIRAADVDGGIFVEDHERVLHLQNEPLWGTVENFREALAVELAGTPEKWKTWGYKPPRSKIQRSRVSFRGIIVWEFDPVGLCSNWLDRIQSAPDWALVWLYAAQDSIPVKAKDDFVLDLQQEISLRVNSDRRVSSDFHYDLKGLNTKELQRIHTRARDTTKKLKALLISPPVKGFEHELDAVKKYVVNLDSAIELYVAACWDRDFEHYEEIHLIAWDLVSKFMDDESDQQVGLTEDDL